MQASNGPKHLRLGQLASYKKRIPDSTLSMPNLEDFHSRLTDVERQRDCGNRLTDGSRSNRSCSESAVDALPDPPIRVVVNLV